jgi:hypothetical protein
MSTDKQATRLLHRKFLERLLTLSKGRTRLEGKLPSSARDYIEISADHMSGLHFRYVVGQDKTRVELYIALRDRTANKRIFDELESHKHEIEAAFRGQLSWERLEDSKSSRIACRLLTGGSKGDEARWEMVQHEMIDSMTRLEQALRPFISRLRT